MSTAVIEKPESAVEEPAATRLAKLETEAAPLRTRLGEIDAEIVKLDAEVDPDDLPAALAARRDRTAKKADLDLERGLIVERLGPLEDLVAGLRAEVRADELREGNARFEAEGIEAIEKAAAVAQKLLADVEAFRKFSDEGRKCGLRQSMRMRKATSDLSNILGRANTALRVVLR